MKNTTISKAIGFECNPLTDDGNLAIVDMPFTFADGDFIPAFVEITSGAVRFSDDGRVILHFLGLGMRFDDESDTEFLSLIAASNGVRFSEAGEIEIEVAPEEAAIGFAKYMSSMRAVISWEKARDTAMANARSLALAK